MSNFEDFFSDYVDEHNCSPEKYECYEAGQQSKQDEVDELKMANHNLSVMAAEAESYSEYWKYERDKLQKRINEVIYDLQHIESVMWEEQVKHVLMVLKGDPHES